MTKLLYYCSWELLNSFLSNFDCSSISVLTRWNYSFLFQADHRSLWLCLYRLPQWQSSSWHVKFSKCTDPFHIIFKLGQMTEIPLGMHRGTISIEKFYTNTVSILSFVMFGKCQFCENYPSPLVSSVKVRWEFPFLNFKVRLIAHFGIWDEVFGHIPCEVFGHIPCVNSFLV